MIVSRCYSTWREGAIALFQDVSAYRTGQERTDGPGQDQQGREGPAGQERTSRTGQERTVKDRTAKQLL